MSYSDGLLILSYTDKLPVTGFTEGRPYAMEGPNGKQFYTDQYALVAHGKAEKPWPFLACSDGSITDQEFDRYTATLQKENVRLPSKKFLISKLDDIHHLLDHSWTEEDVEKKISMAKMMQKKFDNFSKDKLINRRNEAESRGDTEAVAKYDAEIAQFDGPQSRTITFGDKPSYAPPVKPFAEQSQHERLAARNKANRKANAEEIRKAQIAEKKVLHKAREEAARVRAAAEEEKKKHAAAAAAALLAVPGGEMSDLFGSDISRAGTPKKASRTGTPLGIKKIGGNKKLLDDEIIAEMDLGIDIEI